MRIAIIIVLLAQFTPPVGRGPVTPVTPAPTTVPIWEETPACSGSSCTLVHVPIQSRLACYVNGLRVKMSLDYGVAGATVTFVGPYATLVAQGGQQVVCDYQY